MPKAKKIKSMVNHIPSEEAWKEFWEDDENPMLHVIDIYPMWCGPCSIMTTQINGIYNETQDAEKRLKFLSVAFEHTQFEPDFKLPGKMGLL